MSKKGIYHVHEDDDDKPLELGPPHITHWLRISIDAQYLYQMIVEYCRCHIYMPFTVLSGSSNPRSRIMVIERPIFVVVGGSEGQDRNPLLLGLVTFCVWCVIPLYLHSILQYPIKNGDRLVPNLHFCLVNQPLTDCLNHPIWAGWHGMKSSGEHSGDIETWSNKYRSFGQEKTWDCEGKR